MFLPCMVAEAAASKRLTALCLPRRMALNYMCPIRQVDVLNKGEVIMPQSAYQQMIDMEADQVKKT